MPSLGVRVLEIMTVQGDLRLPRKSRNLYRDQKTKGSLFCFASVFLLVSFSK